MYCMYKKPAQNMANLKSETLSLKFESGCRRYLGPLQLTTDGAMRLAKANIE